MNRREFLRTSGAVAVVGTTDHSSAIENNAPLDHWKIPHFEFEEVSLHELGRAIRSGTYSAVKVAEQYLTRIRRVDRQGPRLNSIIELNPDAIADAARLDRTRKSGVSLGLLHGIPILLKDNIDTHGRMSTSAGSLALANSRRKKDAFLVANLRRAGAVILGKTNLSEWANFRSSRSTSGWSARGGLTKNPYVLDRNTSGSSSGSAAAVSANLCAAALGTETDGSIMAPSSYNGIVGLKPTVGLISRNGIIPIAQSQDTAGPMARSVEDIAFLLNVLAGRDSADAASQAQSEKVTDYSGFLDRDGLRGARLGVARHIFTSGILDASFAEALAACKSCGVELIDPVELRVPDELGAAEIQVLRYEFKVGLNTYLETVGPDLPAHSLAELIEFNEKYRVKEMPYFEQEEFVKSQEKGPLTESAYLDAKRICRKFGAEQIDAALAKDRLDGIIAPTAGPAHRTDLVYGDRPDIVYTSTLAAVAGYPSITVPMGFVMGLPVGLTFFGAGWSEGKLIRLAYAFERQTKARRKPEFRETI